MNREQERQAVKALKKKYGKYFSNGIEILLAMASEHLDIPLGHLCIKYIEVNDKGKFLEDLRYMVEGVQSGEIELEQIVTDVLGKE